MSTNGINQDSTLLEVEAYVQWVSDNIITKHTRFKIKNFEIDLK